MKTQNIYLLDIISSEGKKETRYTRSYKTRASLMRGYRRFNNFLEEGGEYTHSKGTLKVIPKILLIPKMK